MNREYRRILLILSLIIGSFLVLIIYLTNFQVFHAESIKDNPYNKRTWLKEERVLRGSILDSKGLVLAESFRNEDNSQTRTYNYANLYSHIIGYSYREYGKTGLELHYDSSLIGDKKDQFLRELKFALDENPRGNDLKLTIDNRIQARSYELLKGKKGVIISMNPKTGEIYSMVSKPSFNPESLREDWKDIVASNDGPLLNRATEGLYSPGSTFKIVTGLGVLKNLDKDKPYDCQGKTLVDGYVFKDYNQRGHGEVDLKTGLTQSCNTYFVNKALEMGKDKLGKTGDSFLINQDIDFDLPVKKSSFPYREDLSKTEIGASAIGQGRVLMTPMNVLLMASSLANEGKIVRPRLVDEIIDSGGKLVSKSDIKTLTRALSREEALTLKENLKSVVDYGTGKKAQISGIDVYGKTGTAENPSGKSHSWFVGFIDGEIDMSVVVLLEEDGTTGGSTAAPIAREVFKSGLDNLK